MIINGKALLTAAPISDMIDHKARAHGVSYGLTEAGYDIRLAEDVMLSSTQRFTLASSMEMFHMPNDLLGVVHDKSTWARMGLSVFNTLIEPGWRGYLTLELVYHGDRIMHMQSGTGIAQVIFHELISPSWYEGKYQDQPDRAVAARFE